ncbi:hypothetical protein [Thiobacillus denitrificans]|uniref:hypothetical protein n=1 Tax=Thiobacillus denitrificans TaxID=36861 RepID=UPI000476BEC6|nr:hypothetical protein [Thiobacillus denitrificans]
MSRWSADSLRIALIPGEAALLRARDSRVLASHERGAASLLPLLDDALADAAWRSRRAEVVVSQHFVRHVLTPPPGKALAPAEERALVTASLRDIYGDEAEHWNVQVLSQPPQHGLLGAAMDAAWVRQLDALLARHGFRDVTIRPLASVAARRLPQRLAGWWALVEPGWLSLFGSANGIWRHVAGQPVDDGWAATLPELIEREAALMAQPLPAATWIQALGTGTVAAPDSAGTRWQVLPHDTQLRGALALAGI